MKAEGNGSKQECRELFPPQSAYADSSPANGGAFWVLYKHGVQCRTPRGAIVSMGLRGVQGGLRGEIEIFPGPPAKRLYSNSQLFVYVNPSVNS